MEKKVFIPLYYEHINFLVKRASWTVTKIYSQYTLEKERFKKNFLLMNQNTCQRAKSSVEM